MESALDVLSRAATMVQQDNENEARLTSKELPTAKWRRERRFRAGEYHTPTSLGVAATSSATNSPPCSPPLSAGSHHASHTTNAMSPTAGGMTQGPPQMSMLMAAAAAMRPLCESTNRPTPPPSASGASMQLSHAQAQLNNSNESPIDMSVSSTTMKARASPPPPYREPLPGSVYASSLARPSVITQAPPKRDSHDSILISNRENDNRSNESISMCETVIDEHFRRSLGPDYAALFGKKSPSPNVTPSPQPLSMTMTTGTSTPTPTPPTTPASMHQATAAPPYHALPHPQALVSPKPTAVLLSPASSVVTPQQVKLEAISPRLEKHTLPPPQQQPLSLLSQRSNSPPLSLTTPRNTAPNSPQPQPLTTTATPLIHPQQQQQHLPLPRTSPSVAAAPMNCGELHSTTHSPMPSPPAASSPTATAHNNSVAAAAAAAAVVSSSTPTSAAAAAVPAIVRVKTEPGLSTATTTPPASPTSSNISVCSSDVLASVDDHFAKALGDTWKKLQESNALPRK